MPIPFLIALIYLAAISLVSAVFFTVDKINAISGAYRVPEIALLTLAAMGGALAEYLLMFFIRHKVCKARFYVTLPLLIIAHAALPVGLYLAVR